MNRVMAGTMVLFLVATWGTVLAAGTGAPGVLRGPGGEISVLEAFSDEGALVYVAAPGPGEQPLALLLDYVNRASWRMVPDSVTGETLFLDAGVPGVVDEGDDPRPGTLEKTDLRGPARALAGGLLDAVREGEVALPPFLARVRTGLEPVRPRPQRLHSLAPPAPGTGGGGCLSAGTRRGCDQCCEDKWHENREDCRHEFPGQDQSSWSKQNRCMQWAALELANCTLRCSLKPAKPEMPRP